MNCDSDSMLVDSSENIKVKVLPHELFKILIATDNHLGYKERDGILGDDSYITFEEILQIAVGKDVDFILLGGDLFHENRPTSHAYHRCLGLLRKYCMGDKPISIDFLSDPGEVFDRSQVSSVNYEDPNYNIAIPVFSIHGNHDDPSGISRTSALDILSIAGLVNYFGKCSNLTKIIAKPILLKKGRTKIALYGISHVRDERLFRIFKSKDVEFVKPPEPSSEWFCIFVLHQNRVTRPNVKAITESLLPDFMNLVIWGHEHDCRIKPEWNPTQEFHVIQPGSSVATSLCEGESTPKQVGILQVGFSLENSIEFNLIPIELKTVRPFIFETVKVSDWSLSGRGKRQQLVQNYAEKYVETILLPRARSLLTGHPNQPTLPLVRLRLEVANEMEEFNTKRFGQTFSTKVANPLEMVVLRRLGTTRERGRMGVPFVGDEEDTIEDTEIKLENLIEHYYQSEFVQAKQLLKVMTPTEMSEAVIRFVDKVDRDSMRAIVEHKMTKAYEHSKNKLVPGVDIKECLDDFSALNLSRTKEDLKEEVRSFFDNVSRNSSSWSIDVVGRTARPSSPVGRTNASASSSPVGRANVRDSPSPTRSSIDEVSFDEESDVTTDGDTTRGRRGKSTRGRGRGRGGATTRGGAKRTTSRDASSSSFNQTLLDFKPAQRSRSSTSDSDVLEPALKKYRL